MHAVRRGLAAMTSAFLVGLAFTPASAAAATSTTPITCATTGLSLTVETEGTPVGGGLSARSRFDIDGDGRDEIIVNGFTSVSPSVVAVQMSRTAAVWRIKATVADFGQQTAIGDFNGDGVGDLAVTDSRGPNGSVNSGSVWIFPGAPDGSGLD